VRLLARKGADVRVASRTLVRSVAACQGIRTKVAGAKLTPVATGTSSDLAKAVAGRTIAIAAGAAGAVLLPVASRPPTLKVAIDLNAVPPPGIDGVEISDNAKDRDGVVCYGAIGVGHTKMKIHKAAIARLFEHNDQIMDAEEVLALGTAI